LSLNNGESCKGCRDGRNLHWPQTPQTHPKRDYEWQNRKKRGWGTDKTPVVGMVSRDGKVRAKVMKKGQIKFKKFSQLVRETVDLKYSILLTDNARYYRDEKTFRLLRRKS